MFFVGALALSYWRLQAHFFNLRDQHRLQVRQDVQKLQYANKVNQGEVVLSVTSACSRHSAGDFFQREKDPG
jgi:hypothetical protein